MKKLLKPSKILIVFMTFIMMFSMMACSSSNFPKPEESIKGFFEALNKADFKTAQSYCASASAKEFNFSNTQEEKVAKLIFSKTKYEMVSSKVEGDTATVKLKITNLDFAKLAQTMMTDLISKMTEAATKGEEITDEKAEEMTMAYLEEAISKPDATVLAKEADVTLKKDKDKKIWVIQDDDAFTSALTGNINEIKQ